MLTFVSILLAFILGMAIGAIGMLALLSLIARYCDAETEWKGFLSKMI